MEIKNSFEGEEVGKVKMSKVEAFFSKQKAKFQAMFEGLEGSIREEQNKFALKANSSLDEFIKNTNKSIKKMDEKYKGMYGTLVRKFLVELEERLYNVEVINNALLMLFIDELYELHVKTSSDNKMSKEEFLNHINAKMVSISSKVHSDNIEKKEKENDEANKEATQPLQEKEG